MVLCKDYHFNCNQIKWAPLYTEFHLTVARIKQCEHECSKKIFLKVSYTTETAMCISGIWLLVGLMMSL